VSTPALDLLALAALRAEDNRSVSDAVRSIRDLKHARDAELTAVLYEADSRIETTRLMERLRRSAR